MKGFDLEIELKEDAVFSERTATEGGHRGLDYIPGGALLGAAAARLYRNLDSADAYTLFHSGAVRFGNARPLLVDGHETYPVPLSWHRGKGENVEVGGRLMAALIHNLSHPEKEIKQLERQPEQLRHGYVAKDGRACRPNLSLRMKTAIDPKTGRARESALFGYDALPAGTRLRAHIGVDAGVPDTLIEQLKEALQGKLLLGRSRSAEYGRVEACIVEARPQGVHTAGSRLTLWLLSDLALLDGAGQPTLEPRARWLGLPEGQLVVEKSFLRSRRYSPWNAHRGGPDLERQVLTQGSVLVFELKDGQTLTESHLATIRAGLGVHRESGLGEVWLDPPLLASPNPQFDPAPEPGAERPTPERPQGSPLIAWLEGQREGRTGRQEVKNVARALAREYRNVLRAARRLKGLSDDIPIGPSASQWGSVAAAAKGTEDLHNALFHPDNGICKRKAPGWGDEYWDENGQETRFITDWVDKKLGEPPERRLTQHLAREIQEILKQEART